MNTSKLIDTCIFFCCLWLIPKLYSFDGGDNNSMIFFSLAGWDEGVMTVCIQTFNMDLKFYCVTFTNFNILPYHKVLQLNNAESTGSYDNSYC